MSSLLVATLVRNEADRYLPSALAAWSEFADKIVLLDDNSDDKTLKVARRFPKVDAMSRYGESAQAWGAESAARRELFELTWDEADYGDFLLWLDADMVPLRNPRDFMLRNVDSYYFPLYDLWGKDANGRLLYREDAFWNAHTRPRIWMIQKVRKYAPAWDTRGIHSGHLPVNWQPRQAIFVPPSHSLLHYAYADEAHRHAKYARYLEVADQLSEHELAHARSIVDVAPALKPLLTPPAWELSL